MDNHRFPDALRRRRLGQPAFVEDLQAGSGRHLQQRSPTGPSVVLLFLPRDAASSHGGAARLNGGRGPGRRGVRGSRELWWRTRTPVRTPGPSANVTRAVLPLWSCVEFRKDCHSSDVKGLCFTDWCFVLEIEMCWRVYSPA